MSEAAKTWPSTLFPQHVSMLAASGITPEHARARGYVSVDTKARVRSLKVTPKGCTVPGLLVPQRGADGSVWGYQYRPDEPRLRDGKPVKYETPTGQRNGIDVPPGVAEHLGDPAVPLWVTEGVKKADAATLAGLACIALPGVWSWRGRNEAGGKVAIADWHDVALNDRRVILAFDSDVTVKPAVRKALDALAGYLKIKGAKVSYCHLPNDDDGKTGLDDYLADGHTADDLRALVRPEPPETTEPKSPDGGKLPRFGPDPDSAKFAGSRPDKPEPVAHVAHVAPVAVDAAALLDEVEAWVRRFCVLPTEHAYPAVALWAAHTHFIGQLETSGRLALLSPEPGSGKTRVLEVLDTVCAAPLMALDLSMSAFFRIVEDRQPTILLDEVDGIFTGKAKAEGTEDLRRVINNGYRVGAVVQRVGGKNRDEVQEFRVFAPVAMAGLGNLPDTLMSRSIIVRMKRRRPGEKVSPYRDRLHRPEGNELQTRLAAWAAGIDIATRYPDLPGSVEDRDADVWEPLLMVADAAGGHWPTTARAACVAFVKDKPASSVSLGVRLLADLRSVWPEGSAVMATADILSALAGLDEAPWADLYGEGLKPRKLAQMLSDYGAQSQQVRDSFGSRKGYRREDLWDAWQRYCPEDDTHVSPEMGNMGNTGNTAGQTACPSETPVTDVSDSAEPRFGQAPPLTCDVTEVTDVSHSQGTHAAEGAPTDPDLFGDTEPRCSTCGRASGFALIEGKCRHCRFARAEA